MAECYKELMQIVVTYKAQKSLLNWQESKFLRNEFAK
jgi:hypothetical protein